MINTHILSGQVLRFVGDPFKAPPEDTVRVEPSAILIKDKKIADIAPTEDLIAQHPEATHHAHPNKLICPGFVDAHAHYPQTGIIASWGKRLIDWLNRYTFPEEMRFCDPDFAAATAHRYLDLLLDHGTTTVSSYCTIHPTSVDALFEAASQRDMAVTAGKTCMDRNAPDGLQDTPQTAYDDSKLLLERWHKKGRAHYAITPRFSPTSSPEQLAALGALWSEFPDCVMQTHLSEQLDEIDWVRSLYPNARDYLDTYEQHGLLGERGLYGHAIHLEAREISRLQDVGAGLVHCPTSNTFIGSGLFNMALASQIPVGLATDTGGGSSFSMLRTMAATYEIAQLRHNTLHPAQLLWLATFGSAQVLHRSDDIGSLDVGKSADIAILDLASTPAIAQRSNRANSVWEQVFPTLMMGDDRAIADVWVNGTRRTKA